jgi:hypothetical protein
MKAMSEEETTSTDVEALRASNLDRLTRLEQAGLGISPILQLKLRLDVLSAFVVGEDQQDLFEQVYESLLAAQLGEIEEYAGSLTEGTDE